MDLITYTKLQEQVEAKKSKLERTKGAYDAAKKRLKNDFGVDSIKEAKKLLATKEAQFEQDKEAIEKKYKAFMKKHEHLLNS
jgi:outer membrane protein TolC